MRVTVFRERCCGSGNCIVTAPEVFDHDATDGRVIVLRERPPAELSQQVLDAAELCPTQTIQIE